MKKMLNPKFPVLIFIPLYYFGAKQWERKARLSLASLCINMQEMVIGEQMYS